MKISLVLILIANVCVANPVALGAVGKAVQGAKRFLARSKKARTPATTSTGVQAVPEEKGFFGKAMDVLSGGSLAIIGAGGLYDTFIAEDEVR